MLSQIDSVAASRLLTLLAISSGSPEARRVAVEALRHRDPREFADLLICRLTKAIRYEVRPVGGPRSPGFVFIEGKQFNTQRVYAPPAFAFGLGIGDGCALEAQGLPVVTRTTTAGHSETGRIRGSDLLAAMENQQMQSFLQDAPGLALLGLQDEFLVGRFDERGEGSALDVEAGVMDSLLDATGEVLVLRRPDRGELEIQVEGERPARGVGGAEAKRSLEAVCMTHGGPPYWNYGGSPCILRGSGRSSHLNAGSSDPN